MALLACPLRKRFVNLRFEKLGVACGVGCMALPAIHQLGIDVDMRLAEGVLFIVVAFPAQGLDRPVDQGQLRRKMGFVTYLTIL
jgi:hypothetical protein